MDRDQTDMRIAIVGGGFGGLGAAIRLKQAGVDDFLIFERADAVGGVWRDNRYPGAACDIESHLYSFSFAPNPGWTRSFSPGDEIWAYLRRCVDDFGLAPHLRLNHAVAEASWDGAANRWRIETSQGAYTARLLVLAPGSLSEPALPKLPGLDRFAGPAFHSARWDSSLDLAGLQVAVIGTGASAIQFVPAIQPLVARLSLFQRTAPWVIPRWDRALHPAERWLIRRFPLIQRAMRASLYAFHELQGAAFRRPRLMKSVQRLAQAYLKHAVPDPALRARLTPEFTLGCKRVLISDTYYAALTSPNVEVVTAGVTEVRERSIVDRDGVERPVDALIFGTGFHVTDFPFGRHVRGREGRTLTEAWNGSPKAYLGTTVAGFPNLFLLQGPNTNLGHNSAIYMIEAQIEHLLKAVGYMARHAIAALEPRPEAQAAYVADVDLQMRNTVWSVGGCRSWYLDETGRNSALWPGATYDFRRRLARFAPEEYRLSRGLAETAERAG